MQPGAPAEAVRRYVIRGKDDKTRESRKHRHLCSTGASFIIDHTLGIDGGSIAQ
jgi:hypothetical protein